MFYLDGGYLCSFDADAGKPGTVQRVRDYQVQWFEVRGDHLYFITEKNNTLYHVHASNPAQPWVRDDPAPELRGFFASGGFLYTLQQDNLVRRQDLDTGATDWAESGVYAFQVGGQLVVLQGSRDIWAQINTVSQGEVQYGLNGKAFFLDNEGYLCTVATNGSKVGEQEQVTAYKVQWFAVRGDHLYFVTHKLNTLYHVHASDPSQPWVINDSAPELRGFFASGNFLYTLQVDNHVRSVNLDTGATEFDDVRVNGFTLSGDIARKWLELGGTGSSLGLPTAKQFTTTDGGNAVTFQNGVLIWSPTLGTVVTLNVNTALLALWSGGVNGAINNVLSQVTGQYQTVLQQQLQAAYDATTHGWEQNWGNQITERIEEDAPPEVQAGQALGKLAAAVTQGSTTPLFKDVQVNHGTWVRYGFDAPVINNLDVQVDTSGLSSGTMSISLKVNVKVPFYFEAQFWSHGAKIFPDVTQHGSLHLLLDATAVIGVNSNWSVMPPAASATFDVQSIPFTYGVLLDSETYDFFKSPPDYCVNAALVCFNLLVNCPLAQVFANAAAQPFVDQIPQLSFAAAYNPFAGGTFGTATLSFGSYSQTWTV